MPRKDFHPNISKTNMPKKIFEILNLTFDEFDSSENTESGGGSTVTKQAWSKILKKLEDLKNNGII